MTSCVYLIGSQVREERTSQGVKDTKERRGAGGGGV